MDLEPRRDDALRRHMFIFRFFAWYLIAAVGVYVFWFLMHC